MPEPAVRAGIVPGIEPWLGAGGRKRLLSLLFGMNLINYVDRVNITVVAPVILADLGCAALGLLWVAAALAPNGVLAVAFFTLNGFVQGLAVAPLFSLPAVLAPSAAATIAAAANFCMALGGVVSPYVAGVLRDRTGTWSGPFLTAAAALLLASLVLAFAFRAEPLPGHARREA